jgi:hypothetical protein
MSWDGFGQGQKRVKWFQQIQMLQPASYPNQEIEIRIVTKDPYYIASHWWYLDVGDAWTFKNGGMEALKDKHGGDARKAKKVGFECPDVDHATGQHNVQDCPFCTTYSEYLSWPERSALVDVFFRIPNAAQPALRNWSQNLVPFSMGAGVQKKLGRILKRYGSNLWHPAEGYSIFITYQPNSGADTWIVEYGAPTRLTKEQYQRVKTEATDFASVYIPGDISEITRDLSQKKYTLLLDGTLDRTGGVVSGGGARGGAAPAGRGQAQQSRRPTAPSLDDDMGDDLGLDDDLPPARPARGQAPARGRSAAPPEDDFGDEAGGYDDDGELALDPEDADGFGEEPLDDDPPLPSSRRTATPPPAANRRQAAPPPAAARRPAAPPPAAARRPNPPARPR